MDKETGEIRGLPDEWKKLLQDWPQQKGLIEKQFGGSTAAAAEQTSPPRDLPPFGEKRRSATVTSRPTPMSVGGGGGDGHAVNGGGDSLVAKGVAAAAAASVDVQHLDGASLHGSGTSSDHKLTFGLPLKPTQPAEEVLSNLAGDSGSGNSNSSVLVKPTAVVSGSPGSQGRTIRRVSKSRSKDALVPISATADNTFPDMRTTIPGSTVVDDPVFQEKYRRRSLSDSMIPRNVSTLDLDSLDQDDPRSTPPAPAMSPKKKKAPLHRHVSGYIEGDVSHRHVHGRTLDDAGVGTKKTLTHIASHNRMRMDLIHGHANELSKAALDLLVEQSHISTGQFASERAEAMPIFLESGDAIYEDYGMTCVDLHPTEDTIYEVDTEMSSRSSSMEGDQFFSQNPDVFRQRYWKKSLLTEYFLLKYPYLLNVSYWKVPEISLLTEYFVLENSY